MDGRPHVALVAASSLDGKIATVERDPVDFTSRADRRRLHGLRDSADAILIGAASIRAEDPPLLATPQRSAARTQGGLRPQPVRAVVSRSLNLPLRRALRADPDSAIVVFAPLGAPPERVEALRAAGVEVVQSGEGTVDLPAALEHLRRAYGAREVVCEGGGELNAAMLDAGCIDTIHLTLCPLVIGHAEAPTVADGARSLRALPAARLVACERVEDEVFLTYQLT